ncbi:MAG TPA: antibiotic biosynthesis monooxygenase [Gammaproteobacteria bacterium]|nr:antibiotic biosynthesis monooxygenase [Gammaproteobacteria bacterium]
MYVVIFKARILKLDAEYAVMAAQLRELATSYGCLEFTSITEGEEEVALSYWPDLSSIERWKQDVTHQRAQALGQERWYQSYQVQVAKIEREYSQWLADSEVHETS